MRGVQKGCDKCEQRDTCVEVCERIERDLKRFEVPQRELTIGLPTYSKNPWPDGETEHIHFTETEKSILTLLFHKLSRREICKVLNITKETYRFHIHNLKDKAKNPHVFQ